MHLSFLSPTSANALLLALFLLCVPAQQLHALARLSSSNVVPLQPESVSSNLPQGGSPEARYHALVDVLTPVWNAVSERNEAAVLAFLSHEHPEVRRTALRGLANMTVSDPFVLLQYATADLADDSVYWFALSTQTWSAEQLRTLEALLSTEVSDVRRGGVYLVLGEKGDQQTANVLIGALDRDAEPELSQALALAINRIGIRHPFSDEVNLRLVKKARAATQGLEQAAWIYGWYRNPNPAPGSAAMNELADWAHSDWHEAYGLVRQYWMGILSKGQDRRILNHFTPEYLQHLHPLEGVEVARAITRFSADQSTIPMLEQLLVNEHIYVRLELLQDLAAAQGMVPEVVFNSLMASLEDGADMPATEWMWRVRVIAHNNRTAARRILEEFPRDFPENVHFINDYINMIRAVYDTDDVLDQLMSLADTPVDAFMVAIVEQVSQIVMASPENPELRAMAAQVLVKAARQPCLQLSIALEVSNRALAWESDQRDSAFLAHIAAGRAYVAQRPQTLYRPDPELLKAIGPYPSLVIDTEEGIITIRMDALRSPATVSALTYMAREGWYPGSPFHRVVNNFVIQGGALWNCPYPGTPPFIVPTEAVEVEFARGAAGIASSGRDTEGSQFFMMHMWHPHLNGRYTNFGHVTEGMQVVDRITQATLILGVEVVP